MNFWQVLGQCGIAEVIKLDAGDVIENTNVRSFMKET
jgi:hypothetical protein